MLYCYAIVRKLLFNVMNEQNEERLMIVPAVMDGLRQAFTKAYLLRKSVQTLTGTTMKLITLQESGTPGWQFGVDNRFSAA